MTQRFKLTAAVAALIAAVALLSSPLRAAQDDEVRWDKTFKGHEMWLTSLDEALEVSSEENRPLIIDLYSPG